MKYIIYKYGAIPINYSTNQKLYQGNNIISLENMKDLFTLFLADLTIKSLRFKVNRGLRFL